MKIIVETTGEFQLLGPNRASLVPHDRPKLLAPSAFTQQYMARSMMRLVGQVSNDCTDEQLVEFLKDGGKVEDFIKANPPSADDGEAKEPEKRAPAGGRGKRTSFKH